MAYPHYTPPGAQPGTSSPTPYPYAAYPGAYGAPPPQYGQPGQPGVYPGYPPAGSYPAMGQTGVSTYGWSPYPYGYMPQQPQQQQYQPRPAYTPTPTTSVPPAPQQQRPAAPPQARETAPAAAASGGRGSRSKQSNVKGLFNKELRNLMYGFGDDRNPASDTVNVMEEILIEFIADVCQAGGASRKSRLSVEDLRRALSRPADAKKLARMEELLFMQEDIKRARAQFNDTDVPQARQY